MPLIMAIGLMATSPGMFDSLLDRCDDAARLYPASKSSSPTPLLLPLCRVGLVGNRETGSPTLPQAIPVSEELDWDGLKQSEGHRWQHHPGGAKRPHRTERKRYRPNARKIETENEVGIRPWHIP